MSDRKYSQAQFALFMAIELKKVRPSTETIVAADKYYNWLVNKEGR